ncbi:MAG: hypothetical protein A2506_02045 [Elusimicrobia bacterium RIFOXYD12_FULL_66_9]|nr:MAG: hypothetical protein A2506_02045 [Elusimicrobia bacterium RIFOXYD12_FULL_66_9]
MIRSLPIALLLAVAACSRPASPGASVDYSAPDGSFVASLPGGWKVDDAAGEHRKAAFFGPPDGGKPFSELISVSFYPAGGRYPSIDDYIAAQAALGRAMPPRDVQVGGVRGVELTVRTVFPDVHSGPQPLVTRALAVPAVKGFFALEHTWPEGAAPSAAFDELLGSFKPGSR